MKLKTILGTMEFSRTLSYEESKFMSKSFVESQSKDDVAEFDTAFVYGSGKSEEYIGQMDLRLNNRVQIATKANPWHNNLLDADGVRKQLETSLKRMKLDSVHIFYLHAPDHKTPIVETLKIVNDLYLEKKFKEFGLSNYAAWQVAEICTICENQGWIQPTVYQGMYNCLTRSVEKELFPCLRYFKMRFYAYNPLCGGILTGKHKIEEGNKTESGRFFGSLGEMYRKRYWKKEIFESVAKIEIVLNEVYKGMVNITEASLRWLFHHSRLNGSHGDGIILGASKMEHFHFNLSCLEKGPLDDKVVEVLNDSWDVCCFNCPNYMR